MTAETMTLEPESLLAGRRNLGRARGAYPITGERRLMLAVLGDAVDCYRRGRRARDAATRLLFAETRAWLESTDHHATFSFEGICDVLDFDADYLRRGLRGPAPSTARCNGRARRAYGRYSGSRTRLDRPRS